MESIPTAITPSGGEHYAFSCPNPPLKSRKLDKNDPILRYLDVKCDGGYIIASPTQRPDGTMYRWKVPLFNGNGKRVLIDAPRLFEWLRIYRVGMPRKPGEPIGGIGADGYGDPGMFLAGSRDESLYHVGVLLRRGGAKRGEIERVIYSLGQICDPPADSPGEQHIDIKAKINSAMSKANELPIAPRVRKMG